MNDGDDRKDTWSMSDERQFIETLLYQRVNFFIVFYSLILAGSLSARTQNHLTIVLVLGTIVCILFAVPIYLLQHKLNIIIIKIREDKKHPATIIYDEICDPQQKRWFAVLHKKTIDRNLIGYYVPAICSLSLLLGACLSIAGVIQVVR